MQDDYDKITGAKDVAVCQGKGNLQTGPAQMTSPKPNTDPSQDEQIVLCYQFESLHWAQVGRCFQLTTKTPTEIPKIGRPRDLKPKNWIGRAACRTEITHPENFGIRLGALAAHQFRRVARRWRRHQYKRRHSRTATAVMFMLAAKGWCLRRGRAA